IRLPKVNSRLPEEKATVSLSFQIAARCGVIYCWRMEADSTPRGAEEPDDARCVRYCRTLLMLRIAEAATRVLALAVLTLTGASRALLAWTSPIGSRGAALLFYLLLGATIARAATLRWAWLNEYLVERRYGLGSQSGASWMAEWLCRSALVDILAAATLLPLVLALPWWHLAFVPWFCLAL